MQFQISWLLQKPTGLDLHCLQRQGISGFSRTRVKKRMVRSKGIWSIYFPASSQQNTSTISRMPLWKLCRISNVHSWKLHDLRLFMSHASFSHIEEFSFAELLSVQTVALGTFSNKIYLYSSYFCTKNTYLMGAYYKHPAKALLLKTHSSR